MMFQRCFLAVVMALPRVARPGAVARLASIWGVGGKRTHMRHGNRKSPEGRGAVGKTAVVGARNRATRRGRAKVTESLVGPVLQGIVIQHTASGATVYTDEALAYKRLPFHRPRVKHSVASTFRRKAHMNGMESFWSMLKRVCAGTFQNMSPKHLDRYLTDFEGKHNHRPMATRDQNAALAREWRTDG